MRSMCCNLPVEAAAARSAPAFPLAAAAFASSHRDSLASLTLSKPNPLRCCAPPLPSLLPLSLSSFVPAASAPAVAASSNFGFSKGIPAASTSPSLQVVLAPQQQQQQQPRPMASPAAAAGDATEATGAVITSPVEVLVKAATGQPDKLGDCPFSQRVLITLEEKAIPYSYKVVDTANKPQWFLDANPEGKVPVVKRGNGWLADSDAITAELEKDFPSSIPLATPEDKKDVGAGLFGAFVRFLKGSGSEDDLLAELKTLDQAVAASGGPFVAGEKFTAVDASLAPKLYHLQTALQHFKSWSIPSDLTHVLSYIQAVESRDSFKKTAAPKDTVIAGWNRALGVTQ